MNLIDLYSSELQVRQKLDEIEDFIEQQAILATLDEPRPSTRLRAARLLITIGRALDPQALKDARGVAAGATVAME